MFDSSEDFLLAMGIVFGALALMALIDWIKAAIAKPRLQAAE